MGLQDSSRRLALNYENLTSVMRRLALEAGDVIMETYTSNDFAINVKSDNSPVTVADEAADRLISPMQTVF